MKIDCVSDLHGNYPELGGGDLLIVAGDLTARDTQREHEEFLLWLEEQVYKKKVMIAGNHDHFYEDMNPTKVLMIADYLCDSGTEFEGLKIWGSPWTKTFKGMNPHCKAFTCDTEEELAEKWALIPDDTDILITHSPAAGNLDFKTNGESVGSFSLFKRVCSIVPKLFVFGHVHESYGSGTRLRSPVIYVNASHVNELYKPVNKPIRVIL